MGGGASEPDLVRSMAAVPGFSGVVHASWSPDGTGLLFLNAFSTGDSTRMDRLWVLALDLDQRPD